MNMIVAFVDLKFQICHLTYAEFFLSCLFDYYSKNQNI